MDITQHDFARLSGELQRYGQSPEAYLLNVFQHRDVVLLAEDHGIRHNLELVHRLIPGLYQAGIYTIGMEFGASEDQDGLDRLVNADQYDAALARRLMFHYNVGWAYREYMDVYRQAWELNQSLSSGAPKFRILNLSYVYDWADAPLVRTPENARRIYPRGPVDAFRAGVVQREILDRNQKILILTGTPHAFTRYRIPLYDFNAEQFIRWEDRNLGQLLYRIAPEKVYCVLLHQPFASRWEGGAVRVAPANGAIDQLMAALSFPRLGFDLRGTPLGDLPDGSEYSNGYPDFRLGQLADGYIYDRPFDRYEGCTVDEHFLDGVDFSEVRAQYPDPDWHPRPASLGDYWSQVRQYVDIQARYRDLVS